MLYHFKKMMSHYMFYKMSSDIAQPNRLCYIKAKLIIRNSISCFSLMPYQNQLLQPEQHL